MTPQSDSNIPDLKAAVVARARQLGFDAVGIARADEPLGVDFERYQAFVAAGRHGTMGYLAENAEARRRLDTDEILPGAKSVICLARRYHRPPERESTDPPLAKLVARYARGHDYHNHVRKKLRLLAKFVKSLGEGVDARPLCDLEPILERAWAARAGLGFIGKNGLVIVPGQGSFVLLGEVVTTLALPWDEPMTERCGSCTRCLDACPTEAFERPFVLDPRRCVAYFTIEDPLGEQPSAADRAKAGDRLFGCDECQSVCPYNRAGVPPATRNASFDPLPSFEGKSLEDVLRWDDAEFEAFAVGSPLRRAGREGLARSAVAVLRSRRKLAGPQSPEATRLLRLALEHDRESVRRDATDALQAEDDLAAAPRPNDGAPS